MLHFGELDAHIPMSDVETIKSKQPSVDVYTYNADHGFQCDEREQLKSLGAAPCASSTAICKMIVGDNVLCGEAAAGFSPCRLNRQGFYFYLLTGVLGSIVSGTVGATGCG